MECLALVDVDRVGKHLSISLVFWDCANNCPSLDVDNLDVPAATADISEVVRVYGQRVVPMPAGWSFPQVSLLREGVQQRGAGEAKQL